VRESRRTLTEDQFTWCLELARGFAAENGTVRNRDLRELTKITYDQAIHFFNRAIEANEFTRKGNRGGTHYVLPAGRGV
jgi:hypothetical protein